MWSLPDRSPWRGILVTIAVLAAAPAVRAQPNDTWTGASTNSPANLWTDGTNWSTAAPPTSTQTAYFNAPGMNGATTVTLSGMPQTTGILAFDTGSVPSYTIGSSVGDGTLQLASPYSTTISNGGAIAVTQSVTTAQTINSNISLPAGAYITNYGTTLNLNGTITMTGGSTTNIRTDLANVSTQASTTNLAGNIAIPSTAGTVLKLEENTGGTSTSPAGTLIGTGVISGGLTGSGTTSAYSVLIAGTGQATAASSGNPSRISVGTYQPNPNNSYSGGTSLAGVDTLIPITGSGSSSNSVNPDGTTNITAGPFGTGTIFLSTLYAARFQPVSGSSNVIYNAMVENGSNANVVLSMTSSTANDTTSSLTFAGPISNPTGNQYYTVNGTTVNSITDETLASPVFGATMILGLAASPSTITLTSTSGIKSNFNAISGPIVINDAILSPNSQVVILNNNSYSSTSTYSIRLNSANSTYQGYTYLANGAFANMGAILIGASTNTTSNATFLSGPFGVSAITPANTNSPIMVPVGGDQTLANALGIGTTSVTGNASGFTVANYWINTINLGSAAGGYPQGVSSIVNTDMSGSTPVYHNLTFTGPITVGSSRVVNNNMASGEALTFGSSGANASTISLGTNSLTFQTNAGTPGSAGGPPAGYTVGSLTVINDQITGSAASTSNALVVQNGAVVQLLNGTNNYTGITLVQITTATSPSPTLLALNGSSGSATGSSAVGVQGLGGTTGTGGPSSVGTGGILGGTGTITGPIAISSTTAANQGGIVYPGIGGANAGTLTVGTMQWNPYGRYVFVYNPTNTTTGGGVNSLISGSGGATLDLSNLSSTGPFDLNLLPSSMYGTGSPQTYVIADFTGGITGTVMGTPTQPIPNGTDISGLFTLSGTYVSAPAMFATVVAGPGGGSDQAIDLTITTSAPQSSFTWTGTVSGSWMNANNWNPAVTPSSNQNTQLTFGATANAAMTNDIAGTLTLNSMTFNAGSPIYTLGGNGLNFVTNTSGTLPAIVSNSSNSVTLSVPLTLTNNLTVSGSGNLTLGGAIGGAGSLTMSGTGVLTLSNTGNAYSGGTSVLSGTVQVAADADLGSGNVTGAALGTLAFTGTTATSRSFSMAGGTITVASGQTVTFNGSQVISATLDGSGTFATNGVLFDNVTTTSSVSITSNSASDRFVHVVNSGALTFAGGLNPAVSTAISNLDGFTTQGTGSVTIGAGSAINAANFQSYGTLTLLPNTTSAPTVFTNTGSATLGFDGGSRTFIGTPGTADPTGQNIVDYVDLHGHNAIVTDGLFVNNGGVYDTVGAGSSTVIADYGSLVKGAGFYQNTVKTQNGGKFQTGNSPGSATFGNFVFGPGGVSNYIFAIDDATGTAGPSPGASGLVSGWGLIKAVQVSLGAGMTSGNFTWTATPSNPLTVAIDTLVNPTMVGTDVAGPMADFNPNQPYSWNAARWTGTYAGPIDAATLDADTSFDTSGFANPIAGTFGWSFDPADQSLSLVYTPNAVPEPGTLALVGLVAAGLAGWRRRRRPLGLHAGPA